MIITLPAICYHFQIILDRLSNYIIFFLSNTYLIIKIYISTERLGLQVLGDVNFHSGFVVRIGSADIHETISGFPSASTTSDNVEKKFKYIFEIKFKKFL